MPRMSRLVRLQPSGGFCVRARGFWRYGSLLRVSPVMRAFAQQSEVSRQKPSAGAAVRELDHTHPVLDMQRTMGNRAVQRFLAASKPGPVVQRAPAGLLVRSTD